MRVRRANMVMNVAVARNSPTVSWPCAANQPPTATTPTSMMLGSALSAGWNRAVMCPTTSRKPKSVEASSVKRASIRGCCPKFFTTRTPATECSMCEAISAVCCCATHVAG